MKKENKYNWKIILLMYFLTTLIIFYSFKSWTYIMILIPIIIYFYINKLNWRIYFYLLIVILISIIIYLISNIYDNSLYKFNNYLYSTHFYNGKDQLISKIDQLYKNEFVNEFIKLLMFNTKKYNSDFYQKISNLGITYLFVISGMHISYLIFPIRKIFKNNPYIYNFIVLIICILYGYILDYSVSILRIFFSYIIIIISKNKLNNFHGTIISAWILIILFNKIPYSSSFIMSYLSTILIIWMSENIKNKLILYFSINIFCFLLNIPIILKFNNKINIFVFFYNLLFSNLILFIYIFLLFFCFVPQIVEINEKIIFFIENLISFSNITSIFINIHATFSWSNSLFYAGYLAIFCTLIKKI